MINNCPGTANLSNFTVTYYDDAIKSSSKKLTPLTCYYHIDSRPASFSGTALTGVQAYTGTNIPELTGSVVFSDFVRRTDSTAPARGVLAYSRLSPYSKINDYHIIDLNNDFGSQAAFFTCLGANREQTRLFLGVYGSMRVTDLHLGSVFEIVP